MTQLRRSLRTELRNLGWVDTTGSSRGIFVQAWQPTPEDRAFMVLFVAKGEQLDIKFDESPEETYPLPKGMGYLTGEGYMQLTQELTNSGEDHREDTVNIPEGGGWQGWKKDGKDKCERPSHPADCTSVYLLA